MNRTAAGRGRTTCHRRDFLTASAALGVLLWLPQRAVAGEVREAAGLTINDRPASSGAGVKPGDIARTAPGGRAILVVGRDAFLLRAGSELELYGARRVKRGAVSGLRILTGALLAVFGPGRKEIVTATATAGIRGTGIYVEAAAERTYFCTCYGVVDLMDQHRAEKRLVISGHHAPNIVYADMKNGHMMEKAPVRNHTDEELIMLERLVGRKPPFVRGRPPGKS